MRCCISPVLTLDYRHSVTATKDFQVPHDLISVQVYITPKQAIWLQNRMRTARIAAYSDETRQAKGPRGISAVIRAILDDVMRQEAANAPNA